jgi:hypothetical protein
MLHVLEIKEVTHKGASFTARELTPCPGKDFAALVKQGGQKLTPKITTGQQVEDLSRKNRVLTQTKQKSRIPLSIRVEDAKEEATITAVADYYGVKPDVVRPFVTDKEQPSGEILRSGSRQFAASQIEGKMLSFTAGTRRTTIAKWGGFLQAIVTENDVLMGALGLGDPVLHAEVAQATSVELLKKITVNVYPREFPVGDAVVYETDEAISAEEAADAASEELVMNLLPGASVALLVSGDPPEVLRQVPAMQSVSGAEVASLAGVAEGNLYIRGATPIITGTPTKVTHIMLEDLYE